MQKSANLICAYARRWCKPDWREKAARPSLYPAESRDGYDIEKLLREDVAFFITRRDGIAAGCGGLQLFGTDYAEVKRLFVRPQLRLLGLGKFMLEHLAGHPLQHGVRLLRLETGIYQVEAIHVSEHCGFQRIPPFGGYREDTFSIYFEKRLS